MQACFVSGAEMGQRRKKKRDTRKPVMGSNVLAQNVNRGKTR